MSYSEWLKKKREEESSQKGASSTASPAPSSGTSPTVTSGQSGSNNSASSYSEWLKKRHEGTVQGWISSATALLKDTNQYHSSWHGKDDEGYTSLYNKTSDILAQADYWRKQYAGNDEAIKTIDSFVEALSDSRKTSGQAHRFYSQWDTEDAYLKWDAYTTPEKRQDRYAQNQARLEELEKQREEILKNTTPEELHGGMNNYVWAMASAGFSGTPDVLPAGAQENLTSDIDKEIAAIKAEMKMYERGNTDETGFYYGSKVVDDYSKYLSDPAFAQYSGVRGYNNPTIEAIRASDAALNEGDTTGFIRPGQINDPLGVWNSASDEERKRGTTGGTTSAFDLILHSGKEGSWDKLSEDEVGIYYTILGSQGRKAAMQYLDDMEVELNRRQMLDDTNRYNQEFAEADTLERIAMSLATTPAQLLGGGIAFVDDLAHTILGEDINPYSDAHSLSNYASTTRANQAAALNEATNNFEIIPFLNFTVGDLYQSGMSFVDMGVGGLLGPTAYGALMGMGSASSEARRLYEMGASKEQIAWGAGLAGAAEMVFEKYSIENLIKMKDADTLGRLVMNALIQGGIEASEEGATELANTITNAIVMGSESDWAKLLEEHNGDAVAALAAKAMDIGKAAASGFFSGAMGGGTSSAASYAANRHQNIKTGQSITEGKGVDPLRNLALEMAKAGNEKSKDLSKQADRLGKDFLFDSNKNAAVGRLYNTVRSSVTEQNIKDISAALQEKGIPKKDATAIAGAVAVQVNGMKLTTDQQNILKKFESNTDVQDTVNSILDNQESGINQRAISVMKFDFDTIRNLNASSMEQKAPGQDNASAPNMADSQKENTAESHYEVSTEGKTIINATGDIVNIKEIANIKDGRMTLMLEDGSTVDSEDVSYSSEAEALVYETVARMDTTAKAANILVNGFKATNGDSLTASEYAHGIEEAYRYGEMGIPASEIVISSFANKLTPAQQDFAYRQGKKAAGRKVAREQATVRNKRTVEKSATTGKVHFDRNGRTFDSVREVSLKTMEQLSKTLGVEFYVFESYKNENGERVYRDVNGNEVPASNGYYDPKDGSIHIDLNAGVDGKGTMLFTIAHELTHFIKQWSPAKFKVLANFLVRHYGEKNVSVNKLVDAQIAKAKKDGREIGRDEAYEEMVADSMETMLADGNVVQMMAELKQQDRSLWQKICDWFKDLVADLQTLVEAYKGVKPDSNEGRMVSQMQDVIVILEALYVDALVDAGENYQATKVQKNTNREAGEVKHQARPSAKDPRFLDPKTVTKSDVVEMLRLVENGTIYGNTYFPIRINTPSKLIYWAFERRGDVIDNNPIAMSADKADNAMNRAGVTEKGRPNRLSVDELVAMIESMNDPRYIVYQGENDRYVEVVEFNTKSGDTAFAVIEIGNDKDAPYMNGYEGGLYNILVTTYPPKSAEKLRELLKNPKNEVIYDKQKDASQRTSSSTVPSVLNDASFFDDSVPSIGDVVKDGFSNRDSDGNQLSKEQMEFFKDTKIKDEHGRLLVMYHGTPNGGFTKFRSGTYFTQNPGYADVYQSPGASSISTKKGADAPMTYKVYLDIKKPFDTRNAKERKIFQKEFYRKYGTGTPLADSGLPDWVDGMDLQEFIEEMGYDYDGLILDEGGVGGYGDKVISRGLSYVVFNSEQVKDVNNKKPTSNPDYRYSGRVAVTNEPPVDYGHIMDMQAEVARLTREIGAFEETEEFKTKMKEIFGSADIEKAMKDYQEWRKSSGYEGMIEKRDALKTALENARKQFNDYNAEQALSKEKSAIEKSGLSEAEYFGKQAVKEFGYTPYFYDAGYITPNGKMLNFSGEKGKHFGSRGQDHRAIGIIYENEQGTAAMVRFMNGGNIRIMAETPGLDISSSVAPTKEQYTTIRKFAREFGSKERYFAVDISDENGRIVGQYEYDGYVNADRVVNDIKYYFENGKVREQSSVANFLQSARDQEAEKVNKILQQENTKLKEDVKYLKELLKLQKSVTGGTKFTKTSVEAAAGILMKSANAKGNKAELTEILNIFYEYIAKGEELTWEGVVEAAQPAVDWLQNHESAKKELDSFAKDVLKELRGSRIYLDETQKKEVAYKFGSYNEFRKKMMGTVTFTDNGSISLDSWWHELSDLYPSVFNPNTNATDMPGALMDAVDRLRSMEVEAYSYTYDQEMMAHDLMLQVYDSYWNVSTLRTVADVKQKQINKLKGEHSMRIDKLRNEYKEKIDQIKKDHREELKRVKQEYQEKAVDKQQKIVEKYQESRKKAVESREKTAMRHKVQNVVGELNQLLLSNDKKHHVPDSLKKAVADALALVNMDTVDAEERVAKYANLIAKEQAKEEPNQDKIDAYTVTMENILRQGDKMGQRLKELRDAYEEIQESDDPDIANAYDPVIAGCLKELSQSIGNTSLRNMSIEQLSDVYDMYRMVLTRVRDANKTLLDNIKESISNLSSRVIGEVRIAGGEHKYRAAMLDPVKKFLWNNLKPVYAMEWIGSTTLTRVFNNVRTGEDVWAKDVTEARSYYLDKAKKYGYNSWDFKKKYSFESTSGITFELTLEQILSLYAYSKREQAHDHLRLGGFVFDSNIETYTEQGSKIIKYKVNTADAHQITPEILADIIGKLSNDQKQFVDEMQEYLSTVMGTKGNEVTMKMYGVKLFKEKFYFPLKSAKQFMFEQNEVSGEVRIKNSGFTNKVVAKANNPVILSNFMDVWANHVNDMSMYHAFVLPLEDFNRVFNYNSPKQEGQPPVSVKGTIQNAYGPASVGYVKQLITDLNGGARTDSTTGFINKMMGMFKKGAVFASLSVVIQQPSAIARAVALVDTKYFIGPKIDHKRHKALWEEVKKYAPVAIIKEMGYFDTNMGKSTQDFILGKEYSGFTEKMKALVTDSGYRDEILSKAPALADEIAWCGIWEAVKREMHHKYPGLDVKSEPFLMLAGSRFTEVITKTQVYDSVLSRSANMRSKDTGMKMATAFMAEPTTSINMIADALLQAKRGNKKYCRAAIGAVIASQILNSVLVSFVYAARDDDEDESYWEKYIGTLTGAMLDSLNPASYIPFIKDIVSIVQGYDVERSDMAVISDLWKAWENLSKDTISPYRKFEGFVGSICQIFGLPAKNIMRDGRAIYQTVMSFVEGRQTTQTGIGYAVKSALPQWMGGGEVSKQDQLYEAYVTGDETHIPRVEARYKDQDAVKAAMRSAIKERYISGEIDAQTAAKYLVLYGGKDGSEAHWMLEEWDFSKTKEDGEEFRKYDEFFEAVTTGKNLKAVIKEYTDNGVELETLKTQITTNFKPKYVEMSVAERANIKGYLLNALVLCGDDREKAEAKLKSWDFEAKYGYAYEDRDDAYKSGAISRSEMVSILVNGGKTPEEADLQVQVYDWEAQGYEGATMAAVREYNENCAALNVPKDIYLYIRKFDNETDNDVVDGKPVNYSAMKKIMAEIDAQYGLSPAQKTAIARSLGWSEKNINKYKLW